jgi:hypothetical protein
MTPQLESARRQLHRFEAAALRDGVSEAPAVARFRAVLAVRLMNMERQSR